jgi:hypothetical protein
MHDGDEESYVDYALTSCLTTSSTSSRKHKFPSSSFYK